MIDKLNSQVLKKLEDIGLSTKEAGLPRPRRPRRRDGYVKNRSVYWAPRAVRL